MALPKGNYVAYQPLKPVELKIGDFIDTTINNYIKDGRVAEAARLKQMQEEGAVVMDMYKGIKIDPLKTIPMWQGEANKVYQETITKLGESGRIISNYNIPKEIRLKALSDAQKLSANVVALNNLIGSKEFLSGFQKRVETDATTIWKGDKGTQLMSGIAQGNIKFSIDPENMTPLIAYPRQDSNEVDPQWEDAAGAITSLMSSPESDLSDEMETLAKQQAAGAYEKIKLNKNGNLTTEENKFLTEGVEKGFENTFGSFDINNPNPMLKQFSDKILNGKSIATEDDYKKVKQGWVESVKKYAPKEYSSVVEKSALELANQEWDLKNKKKNFYKQDNPTQSDSKPPSYSFVEGGTITRKAELGGSIDYNNATVINLKNKEHIVGLKVPNSNGTGTHHEYFITGKDKNGRMAIDQPAKAADVFSRLQGYGVNPIVFKAKIDSSPITKRSNYNKSNDLGEIKYDEVYRYGAVQE